MDHGIAESTSSDPIPLDELRNRHWQILFKSDLARYKTYLPGRTSLAVFCMNQGLWALLQYRVASALYHSGLNASLKRPAMLIMVAWQKIIQITTGISLPYSAKIGAGFYIGHFGNIIINDDAEIGENCNISQGVTIGVSGRGASRGAPHIGNRVYIGANAVVAGKIEVGDDVVIAACSLVTRNVPNSSIVMGVPAQVCSARGSADYILNPLIQSGASLPPSV